MVLLDENIVRFIKEHTGFAIRAVAADRPAYMMDGIQSCRTSSCLIEYNAAVARFCAVITSAIDIKSFYNVIGAADVESCIDGIILGAGNNDHGFEWFLALDGNRL